MTEIMPCDIHKEDPLGKPLKYEAKYDLVIASFCLMAGCLSKEEYQQAWQRIATLVKPGGFIIVMDALEETMYLVGGVKFSSVPINMETVKKSVVSAHLEMVKSIEDTFSGEGTDLSDASKWHFTMAKKT